MEYFVAQQRHHHHVLMLQVGDALHPPTEPRGGRWRCLGGNTTPAQMAPVPVRWRRRGTGTGPCLRIGTTVQRATTTIISSFTMTRTRRPAPLTPVDTQSATSACDASAVASRDRMTERMHTLDGSCYLSDTGRILHIQTVRGTDFNTAWASWPQLDSSATVGRPFPLTNPSTV